MSNRKIMAAADVRDAIDDKKIQALTALAVRMEQNQADGLLINVADRLPEQQVIALVRAVSLAADLPLTVVRECRRFEDAKKIIYAGAAQIAIPYDRDAEAAIEETIGRFGSHQTAVFVNVNHKPLIQAWERLKMAGVREVYLPTAVYEMCRGQIEAHGMQAVLIDRFDTDGAKQEPSEAGSAPGSAWTESAREKIAAFADLLGGETLSGFAGILTEDEIASISYSPDFASLKVELKARGIPVNVFESGMDFKEFKLNDDGLIPVVVQDYKSGRVLMLAYMNEASYAETLRSGRMTYFSRSRQELWKKGETSGHYQFVKSIDIDCDNDALLAKVAQVGPACHTGHESCFFTNLVQKPYDDVNPLTIFDEIMDTILDRKAHPKEGSYTTYLFDKGVDKILKKVGEEATEIVIAAKNPDDGELKYEICDFLYHLMVLMAERGVTWKEIARELAARH